MLPESLPTSVALSVISSMPCNSSMCTPAGEPSAGACAAAWAQLRSASGFPHTSHSLRSTS